MTDATIVPWFSATKPVVAVLVGQLVDAGHLTFDDPVALHVPAFAAHGKAGVTIRHLLTHTVALERDLDGAELLGPWDRALDAVCDMRLQPGTVPGKVAAYTAFASWHVLGEIVQRVVGTQLSRYVRAALFDPLGMDDCWLGMTADEALDVGPRSAQMIDTTTPKPVPLPESGRRYWTAPVPGMGGCGPMRSLARLYAALAAADGEGAAARDASAALGLRPDTVRQMTSTQRSRLRDPFYGSDVSWGLGFITDRRLFAGLRCSSRTFGHDGRRCAVAFADSEQGLVVCILATAMPEDAVHRRRMRKLVDSLLDDLGVAAGVRTPTRSSRRVGGD